MNVGNSRNIWPSIWMGSFESKRAFDLSPHLQGVHSVLDKLDDQILASRHPFSIQAYCAACDAITDMRVTWHYGAANPQGSINPAWTETAICSHCRLNSRMRAVVDYLKSLTASGACFESVYLAEQATPSYKVIKNLFRQVVSSEYLGPDKTSGSKSFFVNKQLMIRHEDLTALSFSNESFDLVITQDVFEHIPDYRHSFSECARIIRDNGVLVFSIPFFSI